MSAVKEKVSLETVDRNLLQWWNSLKHDLAADPEQCRTQIDRWLDYRLALMREREP